MSAHKEKVQNCRGGELIVFNVTKKDSIRRNCELYKLTHLHWLTIVSGFINET